MEDMDTGSKALQNAIRDKEIRSIAIPPLGSGLGGLNWNEVRSRVEEALRGFNDPGTGHPALQPLAVAVPLRRLAALQERCPCPDWSRG